MEAAAKTFFYSKHFAVAGASQVPEKFGYKVLAWYHARSLSIRPVTPSRTSISIQDISYPTVASPYALPYPAETSLSIITQPSVTKRILKEAKDAGVPAVWLQPGSFDDEDLDFIKKEFKAGVGGMEFGTNGSEGWCVLVDGDEAMRAAAGIVEDRANL